MADVALDAVAARAESAFGGRPGAAGPGAWLPSVMTSGAFLIAASGQI